MSFQDNTTSEEEYFHKLAQEQLNKLREVAAIEDAEAAAKAAKELHFHKCGKCGTDMEPSCSRALRWDQVMERSSSTLAAGAAGG